ncbi:MAG: CBS domain-containing protein, partial [Leptolyngbyaceae cyanobacterium RM2_2_4]|nr:CBS domain-containing protein [Leptolyngbyaceae cyanobacterium RM2_2_4]
MYVAAVGEFIQATPVCTQTARLKAVLRLFRQARCQRVIVADGQHLVGTLSLHRLTSFLFEAEVEAPDSRSHGSEAAIAPWQQTLQELFLSAENADLLEPLYEPLVELSANLPISQLAPYLKDLEQRQYALIDQSGDCLGLLNQTQLLKFLALNPTPELQERSPGIAEMQRLGQSGEKTVADDPFKAIA